MTDENVTNQNNVTETQASNPYDALFKEVMTEIFSQLDIPIKTEQEVSRKPRTIDVVIIRKLKTEYKNYPLLLFAPILKFKEFVKHAIDNNRLKYLEYAYLLHPQITREVLMMTGRIPIPEENVKFIVKDLGIERILRNADIDEVVRYIDVEDRLRGIDVEDRLRGIDVENIVQNLSDEDIQKLQKLLNSKNK